MIMDNNAYDVVPFKIPFPSDFADERDEDVLLRANQMCATAEAIMAAMAQSGQTPAITEDDRLEARNRTDDTHAISSVEKTAVALHLTALLQEYDQSVVQSAQQIRNLCTNLLIEKAVDGKTEAVQLRAVEMLGKIKDVALFEERSTVMVEHMTSEEIQTRLREKVNNLRSKVTLASQSQPITTVDAAPTPETQHV